MNNFDKALLYTWIRITIITDNTVQYPRQYDSVDSRDFAQTFHKIYKQNFQKVHNWG